MRQSQKIWIGWELWAFSRHCTSEVLINEAIMLTKREPSLRVLSCSEFFTGDLEDIQIIIITFADERKLGGTVNSLEDIIFIQEDLSSLE